MIAWRTECLPRCSSVLTTIRSVALLWRTQWCWSSQWQRMSIILFESQWYRILRLYTWSALSCQALAFWDGRKLKIVSASRTKEIDNSNPRLQKYPAVVNPKNWELVNEKCKTLILCVWMFLWCAAIGESGNTRLASSYYCNSKNVEE